MKATSLLTFGLLSLSFTAAVGPALAGEQYQKAFDATYDSVSAGTKMKMHMAADGKGMMRSETEMPGGSKTVSIIDYPNHLCYTIMEAQKMIMKSAMKESGKPMDAVEAKRLKATDLGSKMINGHMSKGWSYKTENGTTEQWIDEADQVMTKQSSKMGSISSEMNLKTLNMGAPNPALFKVPTSGYKVTAM